MSTPGRRKALRALGRAKRANRQRYLKGQKPKIGGKTVSWGTFSKKTGGIPASWKAAKRKKS